MNPELDRVIDRFLESVRWAVDCIKKSGYSLPSSAAAWSLNGMRQHGVLPSGVTYYKHGFGVAVSSDTRTVDFDFGEMGETDGFDAWRLSNFAEDNRISTTLTDEGSFSAALEAARAEGTLVKRGHLYYRRERRNS